MRNRPDKEVDKTVMAFIEAICPEYPNLYLASFNEQVALEDATALLNDLRADVARADARYALLFDKVIEQGKEIEGLREELSRAYSAQGDGDGK